MLQYREHDWRVAIKGEPASSSIHRTGCSLFTEFPKLANWFTFTLEHLVIVKQEIQMGKASPDMEHQPETKEMQRCYRRVS